MLGRLLPWSLSHPPVFSGVHFPLRLLQTQDQEECFIRRCTLVKAFLVYHGSIFHLQISIIVFRFT
jgi:hypothetical protein